MPVLRPSRALLLMLVACFVVAAVHAPAARYKSATYSVVPPDGWTTSTENLPKGAVAFLGPHELGPQVQDFIVNITVTVEHAPHETLTQYVEAMRRQLASPKEMKIRKDGASVLGGNTPAHTIFGELHVANHAELPVLLTHEVIAMHNDRAFILVLTYPKGIATANEKRYVAIFDKLVASFQWEKETALKK